MLERVQHIEGLDAHEDHELFDDTPPGANIIRFYVEQEEMPFLTAQAGEVVRKNFVYVEAIVNLGNLHWQRRVRDKVEFDAVKGQWVIKKLAPGTKSDIRRWPNEWNAFMRGSHDGQVIGAPLLLLFKNDPSRVAHYAASHIKTIESLAACTESHIQLLGMGAREDVSKAQSYLKRLEEQAPATEMKFLLEQKDQQIQSLQGQLTDLSGKLSQLIEAQGAEKAKGRGKQKAQEEATE
jgi:hypothetical protein